MIPRPGREGKNPRHAAGKDRGPSDVWNANRPLRPSERRAFMRVKRLLTGSVTVLAAATLAATLSAAGDKRPPRIVAAVMQDADGDGRADRVGLVYSERVQHAADRDGAYPFLVAGYKIRAVGAANGNTVVLTLAEKAAVDAAARPSVRYGRTKADSILDRARNQALAQV